MVINWCDLRHKVMATLHAVKANSLTHICAKEYESEMEIGFSDIYKKREESTFAFRQHTSCTQICPVSSFLLSLPFKLNGIIPNFFDRCV